MLKLSSSTTLRLKITHEHVTTFNEHPILPVLSAHFDGPAPIEFRSLKINLDSNGYWIRIVASTSLPTSPIPHAHVMQAVANIDAELSLSLSFLHVGDFKNLVDMILRRACEVLPLSKLEFLSIFSPVRARQVNWGEVFRHFTEVTTVQLYGYGTTGLLQALTPPQNSRGKGRKRGRGNKGRGTQRKASNNDDNDSVSTPVHMPIFPKLASLLLEMLDFNTVVPGSGVLYDLVLSAVKRRKEKKTPLSTLGITHCAIRAEEAAALKKIVSDLRLDHDKCDDDDDDDEDDEDDDDDDDYYHDHNGDYDYDNYDYSDYSDI